MGVEQELELVNYFSPPVDVLHILQDDRNGVYVRVRLFRVRKSFSQFSACLAVTENDIFRKMTSG